MEKEDIKVSLFTDDKNQQKASWEQRSNYSKVAGHKVNVQHNTEGEQLDFKTYYKATVIKTVQDG